MMKTLQCTLVILLMMTAMVSADVLCDANPPDWRGESGTTYQSWSFSIKEDPAAPDVGWNNPYGTPSIDLVGDFSTNTVWLNEDYGHQGIWIVDRVIDSDMVLSVPNSPVQNLYKLLWLQIVYSSQEDNAPIVYVLPEGGDYTPMVLQSTTPIDDKYNSAVYALTIMPNPTSETISIRPWDCQVYIDCVTLDTRCIPEPMTFVMLGLGCLLLRKRIF